MTTFFRSDSAGPGLHALVVGVGEYQHLPGGSGPALPDTMGLEQLASPLPSAELIANWILRDYYNPTLPLRSLEVVASRGLRIEFNGTVLTSEGARLEQIRAGFDAWFTRANEDGQNITLLYWCGHGIEKARLYLLAEDFGAAPLNPWAHSVDFSTTHLGMASCAPRTQLYLVDSCRAVTSAARNAIEINATSLVGASLHADFQLDQPLFTSASRGRMAWAQAGMPTPFAAGLIECFGGAGSERRGGNWVVTPGRIHAALQSAMRNNRAIDMPDQFPTLDGRQIGSPVIHVLREPPLVPFSARCEPPGVGARLEMLLIPDGATGPSQRGRPVQDEWLTDVAPGGYLLDALFDVPDLRVGPGGEREIWAMPPAASGRLEVEGQ